MHEKRWISERNQFREFSKKEKRFGSFQVRIPKRVFDSQQRWNNILLGLVLNVVGTPRFSKKKKRGFSQLPSYENFWKCIQFAYMRLLKKESRKTVENCLASLAENVQKAFRTLCKIGTLLKRFLVKMIGSL